MLSVSLQLVKKCVQCLAELINKVTHNYKLVSDCFQKFYGNQYYHCVFLLVISCICAWFYSVMFCRNVRAKEEKENESVVF